MARPTTWIVDLTHYLDARGEVPPGLPPVARYMGAIVAEVSLLAPDEVHDLSLGCRRRPGHRRCPGRVHALQESATGAVVWQCSDCGADGRVSNWQGSPWDRRSRRDARAEASEALTGFTPLARRAWLSVPVVTRLRILNNVWCVACGLETSMAVDRASVSRADLVLLGRCTRCNGSVARVIEEAGGR